MVIAQIESDGSITTIARMKEMVGLGRLSFPSQELATSAMDKAIAALARFRRAARQRHAEKILAVATSAVREATNGGDLIERAKRELSLNINVISAREEARLIYLAVRHALPLRRSPQLIIDVGGGSVEFIVGDGQKAMLLESRKLGAARLTAKFISSDPPSDSELASLRKHIHAELGTLSARILRHKPAGCVGTSGTLENLAAMCAISAGSGNGSRASTKSLERSGMERLESILVRSKASDRAEMHGLDEQRRDQIICGAVVVGAVMKMLRIGRIQVCGSALREGILLDYVNRHIPELVVRRDVPDPRRRNVLDLCRRCDWHRNHSQHVAMLCMELFDELKGLHGLGDAERELIEYAALLHDIGWHISGKGHHKHSMYLILNGGLKQFGGEEVRIIANIARYHRKSPPKMQHASYAELPPAARRVVDVGSALLRIADGMDRSHGRVIRGLRCDVSKKRIRCIVSADGDSQLEIWGAKRKSEFFTRVFDREIQFTVGEP
jgi:exopolyphosphatase/guanosine-5'-triphosphate,3'-diphosphate pyrophosphatase